MKQKLTVLSLATFFVFVLSSTTFAPASDAAIFGGCSASCSAGECKTSNKFAECGCCTSGSPYCGSSADCADQSGGCTSGPAVLDGVSFQDLSFVRALTTVARSFGNRGEAVAVAAEQVLDAAMLGDAEGYVEAVARFDASVEALRPKQALVIETYLEAESETRFTQR